MRWSGRLRRGLHGVLWRSGKWSNEAKPVAPALPWPSRQPASLCSFHLANARDRVSGSGLQPATMARCWGGAVNSSS